ncbi:MAG TPA: bifunctional 4-hydroxy-2-oxoglutarate aldolase/2-dehydro-3-deoxy-phosphogluconate aldolase [Pyrinomonadaceae bacterium]|nr:bifunctional 4-hydroxy-2-oxoglutarate aldolase/2-dehydro-3-deoxy-phosphogluconate aldolase [Pyrinomonadaceae bacterium]
MEKRSVLARIEEVGIIPVVRVKSGDQAIAVAEVIRDAGIPVLEITMTVPDAVKVIEKLSNRYGADVLIGAGTVLNPETAGSCINAGAQFVVSPVLNLQTVELCKNHSVAVFPGGLTPTEVYSAWEAGADAVKIFPCNMIGGAKYLRALKAPLPHINLIPTGGVSLSTASDLIAAGALALGVGSELVNTEAIEAGDFGTVAANARSYLAAIRQARST